MNLPDINFWIALCFQTHVHHGSAKTWMQQICQDIAAGQGVFLIDPHGDLATSILA